MTRKVYTYPGKANIVVPVPCGRAFINVEFKDGCLNKKQARPAIYSTGDPVMQMIIENSPQFGHRIFLRDTFEPAGSESVAEEKAKEETNDDDTSSVETKEYPEVTTWEDAVKILKAVPGIKVTQLRTLASAKKAAALNGIVFPNYNFE